jgi:ABC-type Fe3+ transport system permease subunit
MKEMFKKIGLTVSAVALVAFSVIGLMGIGVYAAPGDKVCEGVQYALGEKCDPDSDVAIDNVWAAATQVVNWILIIVGIICVVFIIFGGIRYATSGGDAEKVKGAKNTLLYAIIGLAIALLAALIVNVVVDFTRQIQG